MGQLRFSFAVGEPARNSVQPQKQGVVFQFDNGFIVSIQAGGTNYCDDTDPSQTEKVANAEVAVIAPNGNWATRDIWPWVFGNDLDDDVAARVSPGRSCALTAIRSKHNH